ncbi:MAG: Ig protein [Bacteroidetes bacterium]|jgi:hypothetical protein|nr:Ig protein [Bacteroidota bacterium]
METLKKISSTVLLVAVASSLLFTNCKKDKTTNPATEDPGTPSTAKKYTLVIDNGAQSVEQGKTISYSAHLVSSTGGVISPSGISWSSSFGSFSGSNFSFNKDTTGTVSASVTYEGVTYTAAVPISIQPVKSTQVFAVVPSAIIWSTNSGNIQLNTVYFGSGASYAFSSDNSSIASVSGSGSVSFHSPGSTNIKVTATINGQTNVVTVPVLVVGTPEAPLPVTRVVITPALGQMFKGETLQLTAKAYNSNGEDVTANVSFNYTVIPKIEEDGVVTNAATVNTSGQVTAVDLGGCYIQASTNGVIGQAEIVVNPDTVILVSPFYTQLGGFDPITMQPNPSSKNFTATTYKVDRTAYKNGSANFLTQIANPAGLTWEVPSTGIAEIDNYFNIVTLSNANNTSVTASAIQGKTGSTFIVAKAGGIYFGGAGVMVMP